MPDKVYEVIALGARYWFLFLMALIVWRSWRWYRKDRRAARKRLKLLPDAGFVGEMVVIEGGGLFERGEVFPVPREGTIGMLRTNDMCIPLKGVDGRHLWFRYEDGKGLLMHAFGKNNASVDGEKLQDSKKGLYMAHGSWLILGDVQLRLRMFAGFETVARAQRCADFDPSDQQPDPQGQNQPQGLTQEQMQQLLQQWQAQLQYQQAAQQQANAPQQAYAPAAQQQETYEVYEEAYETYAEQYQQPWPEAEAPAWDDDTEALPYDMAQIAREEGLVDDTIFMRPAGQKKPELPVYEPEQQVFYPPVTDEEDDPAEEEDWVLEPAEYVWEDDGTYETTETDKTDETGEDDSLPRSAYVGHDEAERAKRIVWDKYFGGGTKA